jgi:O-antigen/teichoic acid export membrane protein
MIEAPAVGSQRATRIGVIARQIASTAVADAVNLATTIGFSVIVSRALQPAGKGEYAAWTNAALIAASIGSFGLSKSLVYAVNRSPPPHGPTVGTALGALPAMVAVAIAALLLGAPGLSAPAHRAALLPAVSIAALVLLAGILECALRGVRKIGAINLASVLTSLGLIAAIFCMLPGSGAGATTVLWITTGSWFAKCCMLAWHVAADPDLRPKRSFAWPIARGLLRYGLVYQVYAVLWSLHVRVDVILIQHLQDDATTGIYSSAASVAQMLWRIPVVITFVAMPYLARQRDGGALAKTALICRLSMPVLALAAIALWLVSDGLVVLMYGESFAASGDPLRILVPGVFFAAMYHLLANHLLATDRIGPLCAVAAVALAANVALNAALVPRLGATGAAWSSCITYSASYLILMAYLAAKGETRGRGWLLPTLADIRLLRRRSE